jgi:hypothetical protein
MIATTRHSTDGIVNPENFNLFYFLRTKFYSLNFWSAVVMMILKLRCLLGGANASKNTVGNVHWQSQSRLWRIVRRSALVLLGAAITAQAAMATSPLALPPLSVQPAIAAPNVARVITLRPLWPQNCPLPTLLLDSKYVEQANILVIRVLPAAVSPPVLCSDILAPIQLEISYTPTTAGALRLVVRSDIAALRQEGNLITSESSAARSLRDISGLWFDPAKSGSGLFLQHGFNRTDAVFGSLYLYDQQGVTRWYSVQNGRWLPSGDLEATLLESRSPTGCTTAPPNCPAPAVIGRTVGTVMISVSDANTLTRQPTQMLLGARTSDNQVIFESFLLNRLEF